MKGSSHTFEIMTDRNLHHKAAQKRRLAPQDVDAVDLETKVKKKRGAKSRTDDAFDRDQGINTTIGQMDGCVLANLIAQSSRRFGKNLSAMELEDKHISGLLFL